MRLDCVMHKLAQRRAVVPMKIDIGNGKILGTKEVSSNGQVSGFTEYAGQEVLVVLPEDDTDIEPDAREMVEELKHATQAHMTVAFDEYEQVKGRFRGPSEATRAFLDDHAPRTFKGLYDRVEDWVQQQATQAEDRVKEAIEYEDDGVAEADGTDTAVSTDRSRSTPPEGSP